ncbi:glycosyl transferase [Paenibacillus selenitireducens]|uniref:Glycosyl transferase n=1 Tax=Paenibacillus selenitireducens TaxID=1324314 RepID=A0A1T2X901_9BACL|nr:glycosyltransferase family 2 protein [Paenibacillus selenitireducens]OPA76073.1 glycosyl transferase [Paenibacillus selenitireducens]
MRTVSVHIVTYNSANDIIDCLDGVFKQSYPIQQIIVVDNASHDNIREVLQPYNDRVHIIFNTENLGFAPGHNQAMRISQADYFLVLNPDVTLDREYVARLVNSSEQNPKIGSATGRLLLKSNPHIIDSTGLVMNRARRAFDRGAGEPSDLWNGSGEVFGVSGAAALYSRDMVEDISIEGQFYDESFFAYKEDVDVAWRAQNYGWISYYNADAIAYHERGWKKGSRNQQPLFIRQYSYINRYKMIYKNDSRRNLFRNLIQILPFEIASVGYALLRDPKVLRSWVSFYRELPALRHKKNIIQNKTNSDI